MLNSQFSFRQLEAGILMFVKFNARADLKGKPSRESIHFCRPPLTARHDSLKSRTDERPPPLVHDEDFVSPAPAPDRCTEELYGPEFLDRCGRRGDRGHHRLVGQVVALGSPGPDRSTYWRLPASGLRSPKRPHLPPIVDRKDPFAEGQKTHDPKSR
jgi:hypothetical protein